MRKFYSLRKRLIYWREIEINNIKLSFVSAVVNLWLFIKWKKIKNKFWISYTFYKIVFCHAKWLSRRYINLNLEKTNKNLSHIFLTQRIHFFYGYSQTFYIRTLAKCQGFNEKKIIKLDWFWCGMPVWKFITPSKKWCPHFLFYHLKSFFSLPWLVN